MTPVVNALMNGYSQSQILDFLVKSIPGFAKKMMKAKKSGYSEEAILDYLSKSLPSSPSAVESEIRGVTRRKRELREENLAKQAGAIGLSALGAYGASKVLPSIVQGAKGLLGGPSTPLPPEAAPIQTPPSPQLPIGPKPMANAPVQAPSIPPLGPAPSQNISPNLIQQMGLQQRVDALRTAGNPPEMIATAIEQFLSPSQKRWLAEQQKAGQAKPFQEAIKDYLTTGKQELQAQPEESTNLEKSVAPQKGDLVFDQSSGKAGQLKDIRNKEALIDEDGKLHKVQAQDIERTPEELIKVAQDLLNIPEVDRSSVISLVTYRPNSKQMFIQYHNGETYVYEDVDSEKVNDIANALGIPVTTGRNMYGGWQEGRQDSRGAALIHGIIRDPKYSKEQEGQTWEKLGTFYDYWKQLRKPTKRKKQ